MSPREDEARSGAISRVAIIGSGSAGRRHATALRRLLPDATIVVVRRPDSVRDAADLTTVADEIVPTVEAAAAFSPQIAIVANPATYHVSAGYALAAAGAHLLIEKPLTAGEDAHGLLEFCQRSRLVVMVGYNLRFGTIVPALVGDVAAGNIGALRRIEADVGQHLADWRLGVDYRHTVSARAELGGGVLNELSHELDYVLWVGGDVTTVTATLARRGDLDIDVEDAAELQLEFHSGVTATLHLDMLRRPGSRTCTVEGEAGVAEADLLAGFVRRRASGTDTWTEVARALPAERDAAEMSMLRHFLECVDSGREPLTSGAVGQRVVDLIEAARLSATRGTPVAV